MVSPNKPIWPLGGGLMVLTNYFSDLSTKNVFHNLVFQLLHHVGTGKLKSYG